MAEGDNPSRIGCFCDLVSQHSQVSGEKRGRRAIPAGDPGGKTEAVGALAEGAMQG